MTHPEAHTGAVDEPPGAPGRGVIWVIVAMALLVRLLLLFARGEYLVYDEGYYLLLARSLRAGDGFTLGGLPHVALSPLQPLLVAALSFTGLPDLWASRLLAAACGALLVVPVATLAGRCFGDRGARAAAVFTALHPALLTFLPFFPGRGWNLYFGSEPLYLLLAVSAVAAGAKAAVGEDWRWWLATGVLCGLAYLTRLEGLVLSAALALATAGALIYRRRLTMWPRAVAAAAAGALVAAPYLAYLHGTLGRWAISGRVQAAAPAAVVPLAPLPATGEPVPSGGGSQAVREFVWGGDTEGLWRTLYALDASGTRMASQYWGVARTAAPRTDSAAPQAPSVQGGVPAGASAAAEAPRAPSALATVFRAILVVVPIWLLLLAGWGLTRIRPLVDAGLWLAPMVVASLVPALMAYAEPRAMLLLAPASAVLAAGACEHMRSLVERRTPGSRLGVLIPAGIVVGLAIPTARDFAGAWSQQTPLQQLSAARRVVGEYLGDHLEPQARIVSWHPAVAIWARRDWRVLPYDSFERIVGYARAQQAQAVVFSRFEPSPLREPPRAFTAVLVDGPAGPAGSQVRLDPVDATANLFVGRLSSSDSAGTGPR